jgi:hypothetical protein
MRGRVEIATTSCAARAVVKAALKVPRGFGVLIPR